jgi:type IV pilus assembly protein PilA
MAFQWYYADAHNQQQGPVESKALIAAYRAGQISAATLVWREGMAAWAPLQSVGGQVGLIIVSAAQEAPVVGRSGAALRIVKPTGSSARWPIVVVALGLMMIFVLAIVAAIALPAYQDYTIRSKVMTGILLGSQLKGDVADFFASERRCPTNADEGFKPAEAYAMKSVGAIHVGPVDSGECAIRVRFADAAASGIDGKELSFTMKSDGTWRVRSNLPTRYLPLSMRGGSSR